MELEEVDTFLRLSLLSCFFVFVSCIDVIRFSHFNILYKIIGRQTIMMMRRQASFFVLMSHLSISKSTCYAVHAF
jgi:hypothetical protein